MLSELTDRSRRRLGFSLRATLVRFAGAWYGPGAHPLRRYLEDLNDEDAGTGDLVNAAIERRLRDAGRSGLGSGPAGADLGRERGDDERYVAALKEL